MIAVVAGQVKIVYDYQKWMAGGYGSDLIQDLRAPVEIEDGRALRGQAIEG
jgi:hypothetical protein